VEAVDTLVVDAIRIVAHYVEEHLRDRQRPVGGDADVPRARTRAYATCRAEPGARDVVF